MHTYKAMHDVCNYYCCSYKDCNLHTNAVLYVLCYKLKAVN